MTDYSSTHKHKKPMCRYVLQEDCLIGCWLMDDEEHQKTFQHPEFCSRDCQHFECQVNKELQIVKQKLVEVGIIFDVASIITDYATETPTCDCCGTMSEFLNPIPNDYDKEFYFCQECEKVECCVGCGYWSGGDICRACRSAF